MLFILFSRHCYATYENLVSAPVGNRTQCIKRIIYLQAVFVISAQNCRRALLQFYFHYPGELFSRSLLHNKTGMGCGFVLRYLFTAVI